MKKVCVNVIRLFFMLDLNQDKAKPNRKITHTEKKPLNSWKRNSLKLFMHT